MKEQKVYVGVDVAKQYLDVAWAEESWRVTNDVAGRSALIKRLSQIAGSVQVICEASGGYERGLLQALHRREIRVSLVQATRVRQYARASGIWAKTDAIDARLLWRFGEAIRPQAATPPKPQQDKLRELAPALKPSVGGAEKSQRPTDPKRSAQTEQEPAPPDPKTDPHD